ncbi:RNA polymerase sigma factor [Occultella gossypii]|uniref:RNA polymerase sigma factor n=1 Tax=Occultella gossypii TaxID=2800820 RepID=UPI001CC04284|nr:sigma-70 family RNA polymerase sigma factor [Occultella gossypii]
MTDDSDEAVWQRVLSGDASAYGTIWRRHRDRVFRHHLACGTPAPDAEDLTATTFLELWRRRDDVRFVDHSLLPWLIVTAHNVSRNAARARRRYHRFLAALPPPAEIPDHADGVTDAHDERLRAVREALAAARPADARLLAMTALEGFTVRESAAALGLSESAAKMRLSRLRSSLRALIGEQPLTEGGS